MFERFYRGEATPTAGRAGLGLAIVKAIVEAHEGAVTVQSRPAEQERASPSLCPPKARGWRRERGVSLRIFSSSS